MPGALSGYRFRQARRETHSDNQLRVHLNEAVLPAVEDILVGCDRPGTPSLSRESQVALGWVLGLCIWVLKSAVLTNSDSVGSEGGAGATSGRPIRRGRSIREWDSGYGTLAARRA